MADFQVQGHIQNIKYQDSCVLITIDERKRGYHKSDGTIVDDKVLSWKCIFSGNEKKRDYINKYFSRGMLVKVKGELLPYAIEHGEIVEGYSVFIQTINIDTYPTTTTRLEKQRIKESQRHVEETPNLEEYNKPDF